MGDVGYIGVSDAELLAAAGTDAHAFASFYDRYEAAIVGYFMRRTGDAELTADLTAEVFAAALSAAGRYRPQAATAVGWLFTIAHNTLATSLRRGRVEARARRRLGIRDALELAPDDFERIEAGASGQGWVTQLMERLPADQREAIRARILDEQTYGEIATRLRTSPLVIRKRVSRGLATLREELEEPS